MADKMRLTAVFYEPRSIALLDWGSELWDKTSDHFGSCQDRNDKIYRFPVAFRLINSSGFVARVDSLLQINELWRFWRRKNSELF